MTSDKTRTHPSDSSKYPRRRPRTKWSLRLVRVSITDDDMSVQTHLFTDDGSGLSCTCGLPRNSRYHAAAAA